MSKPEKSNAELIAESFEQEIISGTVWSDHFNAKELKSSLIDDGDEFDVLEFTTGLSMDQWAQIKRGLDIHGNAFLSRRHGKVQVLQMVEQSVSVSWRGAPKPEREPDLLDVIVSRSKTRIKHEVIK